MPTTGWKDLPAVGEVLLCKDCGMRLLCKVACGTASTHATSLICCGRKLQRMTQVSFQPLTIEVHDAESTDPTHHTNPG